MTLEADISLVAPANTTYTTDPALEDEELGNVISAESYKYYSTPVRNNSNERSHPSLDPHEDPLCYKSFFTKECADIVHQLQSRGTQEWSAGKRKLEELDISTIEAEPAPFYCTPKSVLDDTAYRAKRRRIADADHAGNLELHSYSSQCNKSSGFRNLTLQGLEESLQKMHRFWADGGMNLVHSEPNTLLDSVTAPKCNLFQNIRLRYAEPTITGKAQCTGNSAQNDVSITGACCSKMALPPVMETGSEECMSDTYVPDMQNTIDCKEFTKIYRSPIPEYRSFFAAECEKLYNQLKLQDKGKMRLGDVSTIEAEPPPVLCDTINSILIVELENTHTMEKTAIGVSQLDLEKMNIDYSLAKRALPFLAASDHVLCCSIGSGKIEKATIANTTQDIVTMIGEGPVEDATQDNVAIHGEGAVTVATQYIELMHNKLSVLDSTQDIVNTGSEVSVAEVKAPIGVMCSNLSLSDDTQDINVEPVTDFSLKPVLLQAEVTVHKNMHKVATVPKVSQDVIAIQTESTAQSHPSFPEKSTIFNAENKACSLASINTVNADTPLQDIASVQHRGNLSSYPHDVWLVPTGVTTSLVINKTFSQYKKITSNDTQETNVKNNKRTTTTAVRDITTLCSDMAMPNTTQDIVLIHGDMTHANATQTIESMYNEVYLTDTNDSTKVIAANQTLLRILPDTGINPINESERKCRQMGPANGNMLYAKVSTPDLDLTDIAHDESILCTQSCRIITSTPLPGIGNHMFIKKKCGESIQPKQRPFVNHNQEQNNRACTQQKDTVLLPGQASTGDTQIIKRTYKALRLPRISSSSIPKASGVLNTLQPVCGTSVPCSTQALNPVLKTPRKSMASSKDHMGLSTANIPPVTLTGLPRKNVGYTQQFKRLASSSNLQKRSTESCSKTGKAFVAKEALGESKLPTLSHLRPPQLCTPRSGVFPGKAQNITGTQNVASNYNVSSLHPNPPPVAAGLVASELVRPDQTFICLTQPTSSRKSSSKMQTRLPGLPRRKPQGPPLKHSNKGPK